MSETCRDAGDSVHVGYTIDDDNHERVNLTHAELIDNGAIEKRGEREVGWIGQLNDDKNRIQLFVCSEPDAGGWDLRHELSSQTCEQLSDFFAHAAKMLRKVESERATEQAEQEKQDAELLARQSRLPFIEGYAVRWADRYYGKSLDFTTWHYARSENFTGCGRAIPSNPLRRGVEDRSKVACKQCLRRHEVQNALIETTRRSDNLAG